MTQVALAYISNIRDVSHSFSDSLQGLILYDLAGPQHLFGGEGPLKMRCGTGAIVEARNKVMQRVLDTTDDEWLFWLDDDMGFEANTLDRLLAVADKDERPIVGGLCFVQRELQQDGYGGFVTHAGCTILDWNDEDPKRRGYKSRAWYPANSLVQCDGTGSACILIHRSVIERMHAQFGPVWYNRVKGDTGPVSEDLSFCMRAAMLDPPVPVFVHTGIRTTHCKPIWLSEDDFWEQLNAPPANEHVAVVVPVMQRPDSAEPFMRSLRASTGLATVYAITSDQATRDAWKQAGAHTIPSEGGISFAAKMNTGYRSTREPWIFMVGDDVAFYPGWLDHALLAANATELSVVGTNDMGNERVMRGEHATHMLIRRSYIDEVGASWDGPGVVCHEGYKHCFVDDEIVQAAKQRGQFVMALGSKVEHLHPLWKKGETDAVYRLGQSTYAADQRTFAKRSANANTALVVAG